MIATTRPDQIDHVALRAFAERAAWIAQLEDALDAIADCIDFERDLAEEDEQGESDDQTPLQVAYSVVSSVHQEYDSDLEEDLIQWLALDPEHWGIFRLIIVDPWQEKPGKWRENTPRWVFSLGTNAAIAHFCFDQYGRRINPFSGNST